MTGGDDILKDDAEHPVPKPWRAPLRRVVEAFLTVDFLLARHRTDGVSAIDPETATWIVGNIAR